MTSTGKKMQHQEAEELRLDNTPEGEIEIDFVALMYRLLEKMKWIIATALLGIILAGVITTQLITPLYRATAKLYVLDNSDSAIDLSSLSLYEKLTADYKQVFRNWHVHEMVIRSLNLPYTYGEIQQMITVNVPSGTRIIEITVTASDPQEARDIAMAYAQYAPSFIEAKMETTRPNIFEEARVPTVPSSPNLLRNLVLGFLAGLVLSCAIIVIQFVLDDRIRNAEQLERQLNLPTLGMMPIQEEHKSRKKNKKGAQKE